MFPHPSLILEVWSSWQNHATQRLFQSHSWLPILRSNTEEQPAGRELSCLGSHLTTDCWLPYPFLILEQTTTRLQGHFSSLALWPSQSRGAFPDQPTRGRLYSSHLPLESALFLALSFLPCLQGTGLTSTAQGPTDQLSLPGWEKSPSHLLKDACPLCKMSVPQFPQL